MLYLCSSDISALINYVGFATWVRTTIFIDRILLYLLQNSAQNPKE